MLPDGKFCGNCGSVRAGTCRSCGSAELGTHSFCPNCGSPRRAPASISIPVGTEPYYQEEFRKIDKGDGYEGKFNWAAFLFGAFWALYRGLWLPALIAVIGALFTAGIVGVVYWFIFGIRGNLMYYKKVVKGENSVF